MTNLLIDLLVVACIGVVYKKYFYNGTDISGCEKWHNNEDDAHLLEDDE